MGYRRFCFIRTSISRIPLFALAVFCGAFPLAAQNPFIYEERLALSGAGDLKVQSNKFARTATSVNSSETANLKNSNFVPFISDSWVYRATVIGTNTASNTPFNSVTMDVGGPSGAYGWRVLINRTDGNGDFNFGQNSSFNDLFSGDIFTVNQIPNHEIKLSLVNRRNILYTFVDDFAPYAQPTNLLETARPTSGTLGLTTWDHTDLTLGAKFTGTVDDIQFYNSTPYIEAFQTSPSMTTIDPIASSSTFDNLWTVMDANSPVGWKISSDRIEWKASGATAAPWISSESPETDFVSDSWLFECTFTMTNPSNLGANRMIFEIEPSNPANRLGIVVPRTIRSGERLLVYVGTESNIIAADSAGTDVIPNLRTRFSAAYNRGALEIRVNDRRLTVPVSTVGLGTQNWKRFNLRGDMAYGFTADSILYLNVGQGYLATSDVWAQYE
ncbi:hypothetical protein HY256_01760 [Candidatus Sumerlaeota bacterium]|nr:hypothetical protein [Candidatus Sumerlaeota bacterium]